MFIATKGTGAQSQQMTQTGASSLWSAVKMAGLKERSAKPQQPSLLEICRLRTRRFDVDLAELRKSALDDPHFRSVISDLLKLTLRFPKQIEAMEPWCDELSDTMNRYIDAYSYYDLEEESRVRKSPFIFVDDLKALLQSGESLLSMHLGVAHLASVSAGARRMMSMQASRQNCNSMDFSHVHSLDTGKAVSAAFDTVDIIDRAVFDMKIISSDSKPFECVVELILLHNSNRQSLAICKIKNDGVRALMFPCFKGDELQLEVHEELEEISLNHTKRKVKLSAAPYVVNKWASILSPIFNYAETKHDYTAEGLGISLSSESSVSSDLNALASAQEKEDEEKETRALRRPESDLDKELYEDGDADIEADLESPNSPESHVGLVSGEPITAKHCMNLGLPMDLANDFAQVLARVEPAEDISVTIKRSQDQSKESRSALLPDPSAPFSQTKTKPLLVPSPTLSVSSTGSPRIQSRTVEEAEERRRRIEQSLFAREHKDHLDRYGSTPTLTPLSTNLSGFASLGIHEGGASHSAPHLPVPPTSSAWPNLRSCPSDPNLPNLPTLPAVFENRSVPKPSPKAPVSKYQPKQEPRSDVFRVSTPNRLEFFGGHGDYKATRAAVDLSVVPISPILEDNWRAEEVKASNEPGKLASKVKNELGSPGPTESSISNLSGPVRHLSLRKDSAVKSIKAARNRVQSMYSPTMQDSEFPAPRTNVQERKSKTLSSPDLNQSSLSPPMFFYEDEKARSSPSLKLSAFKNLFKRTRSKSSSKSQRPAGPDFLSPATLEVEQPVATTAAPLDTPAPSTAPASAPAAISASDPDTPAMIESSAPTLHSAQNMGLGLFLDPQGGSEEVVHAEQSTIVPTGPDGAQEITKSASAGSSTSSKLERPLFSIYRANHTGAGFGVPKSDSAGSAVSKSSKASAKAVCTESNNRTVVASSNSLPRSLNSASSFRSARELQSLNSSESLSTANTSVGSTDAWNRFLQQKQSIAFDSPEPAKKADPAFHTVVESPAVEPTEAPEPAVTVQATALAKAIEVAPGEIPVNVSTTAPKHKFDNGTPLPSPPLSRIDSPAASTQSRVSFADESDMSIFNCSMWVSKWTAAGRWVPMSQEELTIEVKMQYSGGRIYVSEQDKSVMDIKFSKASEARRSSAHDVEVRSKKDVLMFRARSAAHSQQFFAILMALKINIDEPSSYHLGRIGTPDSDSISMSTRSSVSSDPERRRSTLTPPTLARPRRSAQNSPRSGSSTPQTIYEE